MTYWVKVVFVDNQELMVKDAAIVLSAVIETVQIGHVGNAADPSTGYGAVNYAYSIGKHEVTNAQYADFLNAVVALDAPAGANRFSLSSQVAQ